ncbi:MAG: DUF1080 domain-containing protein [Planctomycetaceae bacterium]|jgi:hypothetical protein|nr:DUF1080 domain-containing protein [Planctomycetaceae bacterium]
MPFVNRFAFLVLFLVPFPVFTLAQMRDLMTNVDTTKPQTTPQTPPPTPSQNPPPAPPAKNANPIQLFPPNPAPLVPGQKPSQPPAPAAVVPLTTGGSMSRIMQEAQIFRGAEKSSKKPEEEPVISASAVLAPADKSRLTFFEAETEDERLNRELKQARIAAEAVADPDRRAAELEAVKKREESRKKWLERRSLAEYGAEPFITPILRSEYLQGGWCQLFDGKTDFGWQIQNSGHYAGGQFSFSDGEIKSDPYHPGLLLTQSQFGPFALRFEYQSDDDAEVFLLLKTPPNPDDLHSSCYTVVLHSAIPMRSTGSILGRQNSYGDQERDNSTWRSITAQSDGSQLQLWIDRQNPVTLIDAKPIPYGHIGFLVAKGSARFRHIFWKPSAPLRLFDAANDPQKIWRQLPKNLQFGETADSGIFRLSGGPGVVETKETFGNFVLQLEYYNGITSSRAGLFFRSRPNEAETGYEVSLQNFPVREDRETSVGVDAGSFRGIKDARYVRVTDGVWNYLTLLAADRHFQTWINGVPVCEITDKRRKKENSPTGPFLDAGTLQFFAPQSGSSLQFRNMKISVY